jgi:putative transcriptional regulator
MTGPESAHPASPRPESLRGKLLVANPVLFDANFHRTVVFMLEHTEEGAVGVVLNRPTATPVDELIPAWARHAGPPAVVFIGGPVEPDGAIGLAHAEITDVDGAGMVDGWTPIPNGLGTVDLGAPPDDLPFAPEVVRVFAGHAGWGAGQLEGEIDQGGWFVVDARDDDAFTRDPGELWRTVLQRQGPRVAMYAHHPPSVSMN